jgi:hypothetical protein
MSQLPRLQPSGSFEFPRSDNEQQTLANSLRNPRKLAEIKNNGVNSSSKNRFDITKHSNSPGDIDMKSSREIFKVGTTVLGFGGNVERIHERSGLYNSSRHTEFRPKPKVKKVKRKNNSQSVFDKVNFRNENESLQKSHEMYPEEENREQEIDSSRDLRKEKMVLKDFTYFLRKLGTEVQSGDVAPIKTGTFYSEAWKNSEKNKLIKKKIQLGQAQEILERDKMMALQNLQGNKNFSNISNLVLRNFEEPQFMYQLKRFKLNSSSGQPEAALPERGQMMLNGQSDGANFFGVSSSSSYNELQKIPLTSSGQKSRSPDSLVPGTVNNALPTGQKGMADSDPYQQQQTQSQLFLQQQQQQQQQASLPPMKSIKEQYYHNLKYSDERFEILEIAKRLEKLAQNLEQQKELPSDEKVELMQAAFSDSMELMLFHVSKEFPERGNLIANIWDSNLELLQAYVKRVIVQRDRVEGGLREEIRFMREESNYAIKRLTQDLENNKIYAVTLEQENKELSTKLPKYRKAYSYLKRKFRKVCF